MRIIRIYLAKNALKYPYLNHSRSLHRQLAGFSKSATSSPTLVLNNTSLNITWENQTVDTFHYSWLRDNCQCPLCVHPSNRQKLHSSGQIAPGIRPTRVQWNETEKALSIDWPANSLESEKDLNPHKSVLTQEWLLSNKYYHDRVRKAAANAYIPWTRREYEANMTRIDYQDLMSSSNPSGLVSALKQLRDFGLCFIKNVPIENEKEVETLANRFGCIRETFYGTSWDVKSVPKSKNIAYTSLYLGPHMDLMYFEAPPGLQFLHSLKNSVKGGESIFIDSFKVVEIIKKEDPKAFDILRRTPVTFHYVNDGHHMHYQRPTIQTGDLNNPLQVWYAPPFQGPLEAPGDLMDDFYASFKSFEHVIARPELTYRTLLKSGDCVIFANRRILHARDEFDAASGHRHFKGTYVDLDDFKDKLRVHKLHV